MLRTTAEDLLFRLLAKESVERFFILFPDPWPKKRHHKRRLIKADVVAALNAALIPGGRLLVKTDHEGYAKVISEVLHGAQGYSVLDPEEAYAGLPITGFEEKYRQQGRPIYPFALQKTD